jgi:hypothetical protein
VDAEVFEALRKVGRSDRVAAGADSFEDLDVLRHGGMTKMFDDLQHHLHRAHADPPGTSAVPP